MPTYEYQCQGCKSLFDFFQSFSEEPLELCPLCNNHKPKRLISTPFFHIKEVKDVQTLAEKNSKRIGRQEIQERELKLKEKKMKAKKELAEKAGAS